MNYNKYGIINHVVWRRWNNPIYKRRRSASDANNDKIIYINPNHVVYRINKWLAWEIAERGVVYSGKWDRAVVPFHFNYRIIGLINHFENNVPWKETRYYDRVVERINEGETWRGCNTEQEVSERLEYYDDLYDEIKSEGYKTQDELLRKSPNETKSLNNEEESVDFNEIGVHIGRNGEFIWGHHGQHRLYLTQLAELSEIPVQIVARHKNWQQIRDMVKSVENGEELPQRVQWHLNHPDLQDITPDTR